MKALHRDGKIELLEGLKHYADPNVRNRVVHHEQDIPQADRLQKVMDAATDFLPRCVDAYADSENYQFLERAIREQTKKDSDGHDILRGKGDGINSSTLQNPSDSDATYRKKAGKEPLSYSTNITGTVGGNGSLVTD